jgi:hypothetical protein
VLFLAALIAALTEPVFARQCSEHVDREATAIDSAVFVGEVTDVVRLSPGFLRMTLERFKEWIGFWPDYGVFPEQRVTFSVKTSWKGVTTTTIDVDSYGSGSFRIGGEYVVYAFGPVDHLATDICTRTREYFGHPDLAPAALPTLALAPPSLASKGHLAPLVAIGAVVALAVALLELRRRGAGRNSSRL